MNGPSAGVFPVRHEAPRRPGRGRLVVASVVAGFVLVAAAAGLGVTAWTAGVAVKLQQTPVPTYSPTWYGPAGLPSPVPARAGVH